jgi:putative addiction module killer protein
LDRKAAKIIPKIDEKFYWDRFKEEGYFGDHKQVREHIWELRWDNGRRIYYTIVPVSQVLLLLRGNKNGQTKDINQAEKIYREWL